MFKVVHIEADDCFTVHVLFRSRIERECWNFIRNRLTNPSKMVRDNGRELQVHNSFDEFCDQPEDIRLLRNAALLSPALGKKLSIDKTRIFA